MVVEPGSPGSARIAEIPEPPVSDGDILVRTLAVGVCGTDRHIVEGSHGRPPPGSTRLVLGHEAVGVVVEVPDSVSFAPGDLVVPTVRRPDPVPCSSCAVGQPDMCRNGQYRERGIQELDGFGSELFRIAPAHAVLVPSVVDRLAVLVEPASIVAKAWDHIERIGHRAAWEPRRVLVTGAGPIGLLAAMMSVQRGFETHVVDQVTDGPKPALVEDLGATYHVEAIEKVSAGADVVIECTGAQSVVLEVLNCNARSGIVCLTGLSSGGSNHDVDVAALNRTLVMENDVVFGTVSANGDHYAEAVAALARADQAWLARLITREVTLDQWVDALDARPEDVKVVVSFGGPRAELFHPNR